MGKIYLIDVTNRDGVQTARLGLSKLQKTLVNLYLDKMGVFQSEFGFPTTHHESLYLQANLELVKMGVLKPIRLEGWVRATVQDVETAFRMVPDIKHLNLSISTSDQMIAGKFRGKKKRADIIEMMVEAVSAARACGAESIGVNAEDGSRTELDFLIEFGLAAKEGGADRIRYCDTLGYDNPFTIYDTVRKFTESVGIAVELHCHSDLGMAVAAITKSKGFAQGYQFGTPVDLSMAWKIAKFASYAFGVPIPVNQPGVGANAFAHASGIHADGVLKDPHNYELYNFEELGRGDPEEVETGREICTGEYSGISGFRHVMNEIIGESAVSFTSAEEAQEILELVRYANVEAQKPLVEDELRFIHDYPRIARKLLTLQPLDY